MSKPLLFYSTNHNTPALPFGKALLKGQAPDKGLYMPEIIPHLTEEEIYKHTAMSYPEIACDIMARYLQGEIGEMELKALSHDAYDFEVPLEKVTGRKYVMRLDQGPTASFKDFAARMMARLMQYYLKQHRQKLLILTATSGDTGSAVASAFYGLDNIKVVVLFPEDEVTDRQRKQMTTLGQNVHILALKAKFDHCQALVKQAFSDSDLEHLDLTSANSINIGRLIPQIVYYFYAYSRLRMQNHPEKVVFSIPSGNFGDMMGSVFAMKMGLPVQKLIIATNENDEFPRYLYSGNYSKIEPSRNCISSAMNVGHPSNLARLVAIYGGMMDEQGILHKSADMELMQQELFAISISDEKTKETIRKTFKNHNVILEPHGAVGWAGLEAWLYKNPSASKNQLCISLETAHPAKFPEEILRETGVDPPLPPPLMEIETKPEQFTRISANYNDFKDYLLKNPA